MKIFIVIFTVLFNLSVSYADQNSPKLDDLFSQLYEVKSYKEQSLIVSQIWEEWLITENSEAQTIMDNMPYFFSSKNYKDAIASLDFIIQEEPDFAEAYNKRATFFFMMGDYESSMRDIEATLYLEPRHFGALDGLSRILIYYKNYEEAFKVYEEMKRLMPNDITVDMKIDRLNQIISNET